MMIKAGIFNKLTLPLQIFLILMITSSCFIFPLTSEEEYLSSNIDSEYFQSLDLCEQVRIYAMIGSHHIDEDHALVIAPDWADGSIVANPQYEVGKCIAKEGEKQLDLMLRNPLKRKEISSTIRALILMAHNWDYFGNDEVKQFVLRTLCDDRVDIGYRITRITYIEIFDEFPAYFKEADAQTRMVSELCNK